MHPRIVELLTRFRDRVRDPALQGRMCYTTEAFALAAHELEIAIREVANDKEPPNLIAHIPPACINLVHVALHFDPQAEDDWEELGNAALELQSGPS